MQKLELCQQALMHLVNQNAHRHADLIYAFKESIRPVNAAGQWKNPYKPES